ncbi:restriction endonuclease subunit S [Spirosoma sp. KCTC 42546]|uniref:restriction endonuclease subunit S n=1 Tax=Spirosoma sp. KCTC 42546 TaxID=2520506 RepID=UPI00115BED52|nr:restriction endonuclease subunit S [Spirosoma sp. KCTC 42546]QDK79687.1 restriction endonuclease subunit S [Spirosoma sp. KCTC 42546]
MNYATLSSIAANVRNAIVDGPFGSSLKTSDYVDKGIPVLQGQNITGDTFNFNNIRFITNEKANELSRSKVYVGDVLMIKIGSIGYSAQIDDLRGFPYAIIPANLAKITPDLLKIDPDYLVKILNSVEIKRQLLKSASKTAQPALSLGKIKALEIPLPDLITQRQIAQVLSRAQNLIRARQRTLTALDELLKSTFYEFFGDPVRNEKGWEKRKLGECVLKIESGWSPVCLSTPKINENEWGVLKLGAISSRFYKPKENKKLPENVIPRSDIEVHKGDLLFSRKNTRELVGACVLVFDTLPKLMMSDTIFRLVYRKDIALPHYLYYLINHIGFRKIVQALASGSAGSMPNISKDRLSNLNLPLPPIALQTQFAAVVERVTNIRVQQQTSLTSLQLLYQSLLQAAFQGDLDVSKVNEVVSRPTSTNSQDTSEELIWQNLRSQVNNQSITLEDLQNVFPNADYPKLRELVFNAIDSGHLTQTYDTKERAVQLKAGAPRI